MFLNRVLVSLFEFTLTVLMSGIVIWLTYVVFVHANPDFDMQAEIKKGNLAVGTLVAAILVAASLILQQGLASVVNIVRVHSIAPSEGGFAHWQLALMCLGHLAIPMMLALITISMVLRLFGRLTRDKIHAGQELQKGNMAVGLLLSSVVLVAAMYVSSGVGALSKALVPQPTIGHIQVMR